MKSINIALLTAAVVFQSQTSYAASASLDVDVKNLKFALNQLEQNAKETAASAQEAGIILAKIEERVRQNTESIKAMSSKIDSIALITDDNKKKIDFLYLIGSVIGSIGVLIFHKRLLSLMTNINRSLSSTIIKPVKYDEDDSYDEKIS